jgi:predicted MPP superfamily phosphohydrolase
MDHAFFTKSMHPEAEVLTNRSVVLHRDFTTLEIFGTDDYWSGFPTVSAPQASCRILLTHNPDYAASIMNVGPQQTFDFALCGHTHGGQIRLPIIGPITLNVKNPRLGHGEWKSARGHQGLTTAGLGVVEIPYRFQCPPEIHSILLRSRKSSE